MQYSYFDVTKCFLFYTSNKLIVVQYFGPILCPICIIIRKKKLSDLFLSLASTDANDIIRYPGSSLKYITYQVFSLSFRKNKSKSLAVF